VHAVDPGGSDLGLFEINEQRSCGELGRAPNANIIFGAVIDDALGDEVRVTVIARRFRRETGSPGRGLARAIAGSSPAAAAPEVKWRQRRLASASFPDRPAAAETPSGARPQAASSRARRSRTPPD